VVGDVTRPPIEKVKPPFPIALSAAPSKTMLFVINLSAAV